MILLNRYRFVLPESEREKFKGPFGEIIHSYDEIKTSNYTKLITVGDFVSYKALEGGLSPDLLIYDGKTKRLSVEDLKNVLDSYRVDSVHIASDPGTISLEAFDFLKNFDFKKKVKIFVDGEEDLLAIAAALFAPEGSLLIYGLPHKEAMDCIRIDKDKRDNLKELFKLLTYEGPIAQHG